MIQATERKAVILLSGGLAGTRPPAVRLIQGAGGIFLLWLPMTALA